MSLSKVNLTKLARAQRRHSREQHARKKVFADPIHYFSPRNYTAEKVENFANSFGGWLKACGGLRRQTTIGLSMLFKYFFTVQTSAQIIPWLSSQPPYSLLFKKEKVLINGELVIKWRRCGKHTFVSSLQRAIIDFPKI